MAQQYGWTSDDDEVTPWVQERNDIATERAAAGTCHWNLIAFKLAGWPLCVCEIIYRGGDDDNGLQKIVYIVGDSNGKQRKQGSRAR